MKEIPVAYQEPCLTPGQITALPYGRKTALLYTPIAPADRILYLIHGGGGDERSFFRPAFKNLIDHMIADGVLPPLYIVTPCFYDPDETDKRPGSSGVAVKKFCAELRNEIIPLAEGHIGAAFSREKRMISGFSMGGVTTWYAFLQAPDLFYTYIPLSGDCWICGEKGGGDHPAETAARLADAARESGLPFRIYAVTGSKDIAFPNLDGQMKAMAGYTDVFGGQMTYEVLEGGVHDYETIFRYLYNVLPKV